MRVLSLTNHFSNPSFFVSGVVGDGVGFCVGAEVVGDSVEFELGVAGRGSGSGVVVVRRRFDTSKHRNLTKKMPLTTKMAPTSPERRNTWANPQEPFNTQPALLESVESLSF